MRDLANNKYPLSGRDFNRAFLSANKFAPTLLLVWLLSIPAFATDIKQAQTNLHGNNYLLSADINYQLTEKAKEALENGVPLYWELQIKVLQERNILWKKTLIDTHIRYRLQYHALLNMYRVVIVQPDKQDADSYNFSTLSAALDLMASLRNLALINKSAIRPEKNYTIEIRAWFDPDALPLPLRPIAYTNPQWYLSSDWTVWDFKK